MSGVSFFFFGQTPQQTPIVFAKAAGVRHKNPSIGKGEQLFYLLSHQFALQIAVDWPAARSVYTNDFRVILANFFVNRAARGVRHRRRCRNSDRCQGIEQRRLADIGLPEQRNMSEISGMLLCHAGLMRPSLPGPALPLLFPLL